MVATRIELVKSYLAALEAAARPGPLAVAIGTIPVGGQMRARFAMFLEFRGDKELARQRNYDCFAPW